MNTVRAATPLPQTYIAIFMYKQLHIIFKFAEIMRISCCMQKQFCAKEAHGRSGFVLDRDRKETYKHIWMVRKRDANVTVELVLVPRMSHIIHNTCNMSFNSWPFHKHESLWWYFEEDRSPCSLCSLMEASKRLHHLPAHTQKMQPPTQQLPSKKHNVSHKSLCCIWWNLRTSIPILFTSTPTFILLWPVWSVMTIVVPLFVHAIWTCRGGSSITFASITRTCWNGKSSRTVW